jgi:plastocyanin
MVLSARRLLALMVLAALGGGATASAVTRADAQPRAKAARTTKAKHRKAAPRRVRAIKIGAGAGWVPLAALGAQRAPLTGGGPGGAGAGGGATGPGGGGATTTPTTTGPTTTTPTDLPPTVQAVGVTLDDRGGYSARLSRATVAAGSVVVQLVNQGEDDHNLRVVPTDHAGATVDFPLTASGSDSTQTLTLTAGSYRLFCTLTTPVNHETAGMNATLKVTSASP